MVSKTNLPTVIITHHTGGTSTYPLLDTSSHTVNDVNAWHKTLWSDFKSSLGYHVGYHYFINKDGKVTQTREHYEEGAHCIGMNKSSIGVCFAGNFDVTKPTTKQLVSWMRLYSKIEREFPNIPTYPHRKYATKSCHGNLLSDDYFVMNQKKQSMLTTIEMLLWKITSLLTNKRI
jgi:hypothetical protein